MSAREVLSQLGLMVQLAEPTSRTLAPFLLEHQLRLSAAFGLTRHELLALSTLGDEVLLFYFGPALRQHWAAQKEAQQRRKSERASQIFQLLVASARWCGDKAELEAPLLLGALLQGSARYVVFESPLFRVGIERSLLRETARVLGKRKDVTAFVDPRGLHLRWKQGQGRLTFWPQPQALSGLGITLVQLPGKPPQPTQATPQAVPASC